MNSRRHIWKAGEPLGLFIDNASMLLFEDNGYILRRGCLLAEAGRIAYIGDAGGINPAGHEWIDAAGKLLMPGFANAHTHVPMTLFRNSVDDLALQEWLKKVFEMEDKLNGELVYWGTLLAMAEMLRSGVTLINEMYYFLDEIIKAVDESGMRAMISRGLVDFGGIGTSKLMENIDIFNKYHGAADGRISIAFGPHAEYTCNPPFLQICGNEAALKGGQLHIHISETEKEHVECKQRHGMTPVVLLDSLGILNERCMLAHCVWVDENDIDLIASSGASVLHCPGSNLKLASGIAPVGRMLDKGINVSLGTDGATSNNNLNLWEEMSLAALLQKGACRDAAAVSTTQALQMATVNGYRACGIEDGGYIREGNLADFILVDIEKPHYYPRNNTIGGLVYSGNASDVYMTVIGGRIVYREGKCSGIDVPKVYENVERLVTEVYRKD